MKPVRKHALIGHIDHSKTSLTAAIVALLSTLPVEKQGREYLLHADRDPRTGAPLGKKRKRKS